MIIIFFVIFGIALEWKVVVKKIKSKMTFMLVERIASPCSNKYIRKIRANTPLFLLFCISDLIISETSNGKGNVTCF